MINITVIGKIRKVILWGVVSVVAFFGIIAVISLVVSSGVLKKPMQYQKNVPLVRLNPGERKTVEFESFCLDHSRGGPRSSDAYSLMGKPAVRLRPYLREIFDEYLSHPSRWKQSDVQQAVWYTEGNTKWESLSEDQRRLIKTATGREDPVTGHPVVFLNRMTSAFGVVVKTNLLFIFIFFALVVLTLPAPLTFIERGFSWMLGSRLVRKLSESRWGPFIMMLNENEYVNKLRLHADVLFTRLAFRIISRKR